MLRLGIVGMGYIGGVHRAAAAALGPEAVEIRAVATHRPESLTPAPGAPAPRVFADYDEFFAAAAVDAVVIATPTYRHERHALAAIARGWHVLCEKPLALDADSAERIVTAAERAAITLMTAQVLRFWPQYVRILEAAASGELGPLRAVSAARRSAFPHRSPWFADPAKSGGGLLDLHIHDADFVYAMLGAPNHIEAAGVRSPNGACDTVSSLWRYPAAVADLHGNLRMPPGYPMQASLRAVGEKGAIEYRFLAPGNVGGLDTARQDLALFPADAAPRPLAVPAHDPFVEQMRYFLGCAAGGAPPLRCLPADTLAVMRLLDATRRSVERALC